MPEILMDIKQIAEYLQMNKMTIYKLAREGKIPAFKIASEWRFKKELIDQWLMSQLQKKHGFELGNKQTPHRAKIILIVDDEEIIRDYFSRTLIGYRVVTTDSGESALALIEKNRPDLVLLDLKMPGIDGLETLRQIKQRDKNLPVIMLSAYGTLQTKLQAKELGAYGSMAKPLNINDLIVVIDEVFKSEKDVTVKR